MQTTLFRRGRRGSLMIAMMLTIVISGLLVVLTTNALRAQNSARNDKTFHDALFIAETGLEDAVAELNTGVHDDLTGGSTVTGSGTTTSGRYQWEAMRVSADTWAVRTEGTTPGERGETRTLEAQVRRPAIFFLAAFGDADLLFRGENTVDSYPSGAFGAIGANNTVTMRGNAAADAVNLYGPSAEFDCSGTSCDSPQVGWDEPVFLDTDMVYDRHQQCEDAGITPTTLKASNLSGSIPPHPDGFYCATDVIFDVDTTITGTEDDPVIIYATGDVLVPNSHTSVNCDVGCEGNPNTTGMSPEPMALQIYTTGSRVEFANQSEMAAAIYAPNATCQGAPSNAKVEFYGALFCATVTNQGGWEFYFDEQLLQLGAEDYAVTDWRDEVGGSSSVDHEIYGGFGD